MALIVKFIRRNARLVIRHDCIAICGECYFYHLEQMMRDYGYIQTGLVQMEIDNKLCSICNDKFV